MLACVPNSWFHHFNIRHSCVLPKPHVLRRKLQIDFQDKTWPSTKISDFSKTKMRLHNILLDLHPVFCAQKTQRASGHRALRSSTPTNATSNGEACIGRFHVHASAMKSSEDKQRHKGMSWKYNSSMFWISVTLLDLHVAFCAPKDHRYLKAHSR